MRTLFAIPVILLLGACSVVPEDANLNDLAQFAADDARAAKVLAQKSGDEIAIKCYEYLEARLTPKEGEPKIEVKGAISTFQLARNARRAISGDDTQLRIACAPLGMDSPVISRLLTIRGAAGTILTGGL
jgi:hypothetical protein